MSFIGLLRTLEQITRSPRMGHDVDAPLNTCPSPTIVQSAPPPTVDGEGPSACEHSPAPAEGRPTSELLTDAAVHLDYYLDRYETSITSCLNGRGFTRELRERAATFKAIEE